MKKITTVISVFILLAALSTLRAGAEELTFDYSGVYQSLSPEAAQRLEALGAGSADATALSQLSFEGVMASLADLAGENLSAPLGGLVTVVAVLLLCSLLSAYQNSLQSDVSETVQAAATLCLCCAVAVPATVSIASTGEVVSHAANLFLAYIPVAAVMMAASGKAVSSVSYQAVMIAAGQGVARLCADVVLPFMNIFLGLSITSGIAPGARLSGFTTMIARISRRLLAFAMTVFTAVLSIRQLLSDNLDSVGTRAVKFALTSFVPVVGGALSEAYKTMQGSLQVLRSGLGVFVILAVAVTFLPAVIQALGWSLCLSVGSSLAQAMGIDACARLLEALREVFSVLIAVLLCAMAVFTVCTAGAFVMGGGAS